DHRVDAFVADASTVGVDIGSTFRPGLGDQLAPSPGVSLVPGGDIVHYEFVCFAHVIAPLVLTDFGGSRGWLSEGDDGVGNREQKYQRDVGSLAGGDDLLVRFA